MIFQDVLASGKWAMSAHSQGLSSICCVLTISTSLIDRGIYDSSISVEACCWCAGMDSGKVFAVALMPDSTKAITASDDFLVRIWDVSTGRCLSAMEGHTGWVVALAVSPDGDHVVSSSHDGTARYGFHGWPQVRPAFWRWMRKFLSMITCISCLCSILCCWWFQHVPQAVAYAAVMRPHEGFVDSCIVADMGLQLQIPHWVRAQSIPENASPLARHSLQSAHQ